MLHSLRVLSFRSLILVLCAFGMSACSILIDLMAPEEATEDAGAIIDPNCYKDFVGCPSDEWQTFDGSCSCYLYAGKDDAYGGSAACRAQGAHLVVIETEAEEDALVAALKLSGTGGDFFIGLLQSQVFPIWVTDETTENYENLASGPVDPAKDCVQLDLDAGSWRAEYCDSYDDIVCELDGKVSSLPIPPTCYKDSPGCPTGWQTISATCSCYLEVQRDNAEGAAAQCRALSAHMLAIETAEEQSGIIYQLDLSSNDYYIGLVRGQGNEPTWVTGAGLSKTGFDNLEDSVVDPSKLCMLMDEGDPSGGVTVPGPGYWRDKTCGGENDVVCELDGRQGRLPLPL